MKIFAAGIATETNTFSPIPTGLDDFLVQRGKDCLAGRIDHPGLDLSATWGQWADAGGYAFEFSLMAAAQPSGVTVRSAYESLRNEILDDLRAAMPVDVVLLNLHGAMIAEGYEDCEEDLTLHVRTLVGPHAVIGVTLDLHCHLSRAFVDAATIIITFKEYPHVDSHERARELFDLAVATKLGRVRPTLALVDCRMIGVYPTSREPMRGFVAAMQEAERRERVLSISFAHGFPYADVPNVGAKILVVTDDAPALAQQVAEEFSQRVHRLREEIDFGLLSLPLEKALSAALASERRPVVVADQSDNPGGGAPGDATFALRWLLDHRAKDVAMALLYDPEVVRIAGKVGQGATLPVRLGGKLGPSSGDPVDLEVTVTAMLENYQHEFPQQSGESAWRRAGDVVAVRCGSIDIVVSSERCQCFSPSVFYHLGIDPKRKRLLIPKSTQHFLGAFAPIAGEVIYMAGPGALTPDMKQIPYRRLDTRSLYPWLQSPFADETGETSTCERIP